jgi:alpha-L-rhamnosidase
MLAVALSSSAQASPGGLGVTEPRTEYRSDPLGIEAERPRFSWKLRSNRRTQIQSAYRIIVASSREKLARDRGDVWDSGKVPSRRSHLVEYGGPALEGRTRYHWKAMVWDGDRRPSRWSEPAWFETGVLDDDTFTAEWIGADVEERLPTSQVEQSYPAELEEGTLGQAITTDRPFASVGAKLPTWNTRDSDVTVTLRRDGPDGEVVATRRFEDVADNGWLDLALETPAAAGAYYLELSEPEGTVGWWSHAEDLYAHGAAFADGEPVAGDRTFRWEPAEEDADGRTAQLRKEFRLDGRVERARLYASALGLYELRVNGERVGDDRFAPGWTDYETRVQYQTHDVTRLLRRDANAIAATISPGWYAGHVAIFGPNQYGTQPWLFAQLEVTYDDGRTETIVSDSSWRTATGPIVSSDLLMGESYDARLETPGWDRPGYDDAAWAPAKVKDDVPAELVAQEDQPVEVTRELSPVRITEPSPGVFVYDLGQNMVGSVRLRVRGERATTVRLRHAEVLNADGTLYTDNLRSAKATDHYTLKGGGTETYEPEFTFHGFRYVEVTGLEEPPSITGRVMHSNAPFTGRLETSSDMLDQLYSNITWGQRGNFLSIPTDTPARDERMGWSGDINVFVGAATYNMEVAPFLRKWLQDMRDAQFENGAFPDVAPRVGFLGGGAAGWGDAGVSVPWTLWQQYGDVRVVEEQYAAMERWIEYLIEHSNGLLRPAEGYGDWLNVSDETPKDVIATAYFAYSADRVAEMAAELGESADAARYRQLAADVRAAFNRAYVTEDGRVRGDTQTAYVLALSFGLLPAELREPAADRLVELIEARDWHLSTGFLGTPDLLEVLTEAGHLEVAYRLINQDTYPSWGYQVNHGATTMWEHWDSLRPDGSFEDPAMNSFNHYAYGAVGEWMFQTLAGIDNVSPGFDEIRIRPQPGGDLDHASGRYESVHGPIESAWRDTERGFRLEVAIPVNTTAEVWVPAVDREAVTGDGHGARFERMEDGYAVFEVGSGEYRLESDDVRGHLHAAERAAVGLGRRLERAVVEARRAYDRGSERRAEQALQEALEIAGELGAEAVHARLSQASVLLLGVRATLGEAAGRIAAGDTVEFTARVENQGRETLEDVEVELDVPAGWSVAPEGPVGINRLRPGATHTARFAVTVPLSQAVEDDVPITGAARYRRGGGVTAIPLARAVDVVSPVRIEALRAEPRILGAPGAASTVTATVVNASSSPVPGVVRAAVPGGWTADPSEQALDLAPGERRDFAFRVASPPELAAADVEVTVLYGANPGDTETIRLTYALAAWLFETDGDAEDWHPVNHLAPFEVAGGVLATSSLGGDPFMTQGETLALDASGGLTVEVTMEVGADSEGQVFWTTAAAPGFSEGKSTKFAVTGGGMRTYDVAIPAFAGTLTGLRLDPQNGPGAIRIDSIRIVK